MANFLNLWIFYVGGYAIAYSIQEWANRKRGKPFDDPEFMYQKRVFIPALAWIFGGFILSVLVPIDFGYLFFIGLIIAIIGMAIGILALHSFANNPGLTTTRIHRYSRNPIYVGWTIFFLGLTLMGWSDSNWSGLFLIYFLYTIGYLHWTVLQEEEFLTSKYGSPYKEYMENTPRYLGMPRRQDE
ncbi:MAG: methyltransferase family protein [Candidatus Thorarchaeota archaeon]